MKYSVLLVSTAKTFGGGERYVLNVATVYHACGLRVGLIASCPELVARARDESKYEIAEAMYYPGMLTATRKIVTLMLNNRYCIVHLNGHRDIVIAPFIRAVRGKVLAVRHTESLRDRSVRSLIKLLLYKLFSPYVNILVCVSHTVKSQISQYVKRVDRIYVIPNWVGDICKSSVRVYGNKTQHRILIIARIDRLKGHTVLFEACQEMANVVVDVVGDGPERKYLETLNYPNVVFHGFRDDVTSFYTNAEVFVLPSYSEGSPMVLLEAMAHGLPCIASNIPSIAEVIENNKTGFLFEKGNPGALKEILLEVFNNPKKAERIGRNCRTYILKHRSAEVARERYSNLLSELGPVVKLETN